MTNLAELIDDFVADRPDWDKKTADWTAVQLRRFVRFLTARGVTAPAQIELRHINRHLADLRAQGYGYSVRAGAFGRIKLWFGWLRQYNLVAENYFANAEYNLRPPRKPRATHKTIPLDYISKMISAAETQGAARDAALMRLLISTGMRRVEVANLKLSDLTLGDEGGELFIIGKYLNERVNFIEADTVAALRRWLEVRPFTLAPHLFVASRPSVGMHQALAPDAINSILLKWRDGAGLPAVQVSPHLWRHTFATEYIRRGGDAFSLQAWLGHTDIKTTRIYVDIDRSILQHKGRLYAPKLENLYQR